MALVLLDACSALIDDPFDEVLNALFEQYRYWSLDAQINKVLCNGFANTGTGSRYDHLTYSF